MARRKAGSSSVPPADSSPYLGKTSRMFTAADIDALAKASGLPLSTSSTTDLLAFAIDQAFSIGAFFATVEGYPPSPSDLRDYYRGISNSARDLLISMGFTGDPKSIDREMKPSRYRRHPAINHLQKDARFLGRAILSPDTFKVLCEQIEAAPVAISLVIEIAESVMESLKEAKLRPGRAPDDFLQRIFMFLAGIFYLCFDCPPKLGPERFMKDTDSTMWIAMVLNLAAERVATHIMQDEPEEVRASHIAAHPYVLEVRKADALSISTKADRMAQGWRDWQNLDEASRADFLMTYGPTKTP